MIKRYCQFCKDLMNQRATESTPRFMRRQFCSNDCKGAYSRQKTVSRFWEHADKSGDCWVWTRCKSKKGYGKFNGLKGQQQAHRVAYILTHNVTLTPEQLVCHSCDNPPCINPDHLFLGDALINTQDMNNKGRANHRVKRHGSKHPNSKFSESEVIEMRKIMDYEVNKGRRYQEVVTAMAKVYGCHYGTLRPMYLRQTWKHV